MNVTITRTVTTVRTIEVPQDSSTKEDIQILVAVGVNNLGFDNVGELKSEDINDFVDDINIDSII